jgi:hypothetical protein
VVLPSGSHLWFPGIPAGCSPWRAAARYLGPIANGVWPLNRAVGRAYIREAVPAVSGRRIELMAGAASGVSGEWRGHLVYLPSCSRKVA